MQNKRTDLSDAKTTRNETQSSSVVYGTLNNAWPTLHKTDFVDFVTLLFAILKLFQFSSISFIFLPHIIRYMSPPCQFHNMGFIYLKPKLYNYHDKVI